MWIAGYCLLWEQNGTKRTPDLSKLSTSLKGLSSLEEAERPFKLYYLSFLHREINIKSRKEHCGLSAGVPSSVL